MGKLRETYCVWFGHSRVVEMDFGYVLCGRCGLQIGDTLASIFNFNDKFVRGHYDEECIANLSKMAWRHKILAIPKSKED